MSVIIKFVSDGNTTPNDFVASRNGGDDKSDVMFVSSSDWAYEHDGEVITHADGNSEAMKFIDEDIQ